ncbi:unnamed protein product [Dibothriocephalus latus]|uniref:Uncharacterized protein n=1 Tax=Dibothriocephalus latus TaxID=60516 RepID=A0A3P6QB64_DIBLA|nr:unnamed protein product [Dibothriocephalus latus]
MSPHYAFSRDRFPGLVIKNIAIAADEVELLECIEETLYAWSVLSEVYLRIWSTGRPNLFASNIERMRSRTPFHLSKLSLATGNRDLRLLRNVRNLPLYNLRQLAPINLPVCVVKKTKKTAYQTV